VCNQGKKKGSWTGGGKEGSSVGNWEPTWEGKGGRMRKKVVRAQKSFKPKNEYRTIIWQGKKKKKKLGKLKGNVCRPPRERKGHGCSQKKKKNDTESRLPKIRKKNGKDRGGGGSKHPVYKFS